MSLKPLCPHHECPGPARDHCPVTGGVCCPPDPDGRCFAPPEKLTPETLFDDLHDGDIDRDSDSY